MRQFPTIILAAVLILALWLPPAPAEAHPHVWVTVEATVLYDAGSVVGIRHKWVFDEMYTAMAIQGLDKNNDGIYSREELQELAQVNMDGLKEFQYFTHVKLGETSLAFKPPTDYYLEHKDGILTLYFTLPFETPVLAEAHGLSFQVYDESFFIAYEFAKDKPVVLANAPKSCTATLGVPAEAAADLQQLSQAFGGPMTAGTANMGMGMGYAKTVTLACGKS